MTHWSSSIISPPALEGADVIPMGNDKSASYTFTGYVLAAGQYTIQMGVGNPNGTPFPDVIDISFAGMSASQATSATTPTPALKGWELWTITWTVAAGNPHIGETLSFFASTDPETNGGAMAIDGVGDLSSDGTGFLVSYTPVPEPATMAMLGLGGLGILIRRRRNAT